MNAEELFDKLYELLSSDGRKTDQQTEKTTIKYTDLDLKDYKDLKRKQGFTDEQIEYVTKRAFEFLAMNETPQQHKPKEPTPAEAIQNRIDELTHSLQQIEVQVKDMREEKKKLERVLKLLNK